MKRKAVQTAPSEVNLSIAEVDYALRYFEIFSNINALGGATTPMLINQRLKDITLNPSQPTEVTLNTAINNIKQSENLLMTFSQSFEIQSQPYRRLINYLGDMMAFDWTVVCTNAKKDSEYSSAKFQKDFGIMRDFMDRLNPKAEFPAIVKQMLRNEAFFGCPILTGPRYTIQELPASLDYTLITGRWNYGLMFSFNFDYFSQPGVSADMYPPFFQKKYAELQAKAPQNSYDPTLSPTSRGDSSWTSWQDIPVDVGWVWKLNPMSVTRVPYFTGLFLDLIQQPLMRSLQKNANMAAALKLVVGEVPMLKDTTTKGKDQFALSSGNLANFLAFIKAAVGEAVKVVAAPLQNMKLIDFKQEEKIYTTYLKSAMATTGVNTNLIYSTDQKPNAIETQLSLNTDEQMMTALYPQFEAFLDYYVNRQTKFYKFKFTFEGSNFYNDRENRFKKQQTLSDKGIVLPQKMAAAIGMNPLDFERQLAWARGEKFVEKLTPIVSGFGAGAPAPAGDKKTGRPAKSDTEISDSGLQTKDTASNVEKTG